MESNHEERIELANAAEEFMILSRIEALRVQIDESDDELDTLKQDPTANPKDIEILQDCIRINGELLKILEAADQEFYAELESLNE